MMALQTKNYVYTKLLLMTQKTLEI